MSRQQQRETNPHFLLSHNDPIIEFPSPRNHSRTSVEPHYAPRPQPPTQQPKPQLKKPPPPPPSPHSVDTEPKSRQESQPHSTRANDPQPRGSNPFGRGHHPHRRHRDDPPFLRAPSTQRTNPVAWLVAGLCAIFWIIVIVGGLIILIVYLMFQPKNPRFDISTATLNAAYLDMGSLLNADMTLLANFTNPNTKVNVDFSYVVFDLYFGRKFIATRYATPFSVRKGESRFAYVHILASQVSLPSGLSSELQRQMDSGRVNFEVRGLFRTRSKLGGVFRYSYWLYAHCEIEVTGPSTGVTIRKRCATRK